VQNIIANPSVTIRLGAKQWAATGKGVDAAKDADLYAEVRALARKKYRWGDGLPVEFRLVREMTGDSR
jgi:hypothetical protein